MKLAVRTFALIGVASLFRHAPIGIEVLQWVFAAIALVLFIFGGLGILLSAAVWRNLIWRSTLGRTATWRGGKIGSILLAVPPLLGLCLIAAFLFVSIGRLLHQQI